MSRKTAELLRRLRIDDAGFVEIESKNRVLPEQAEKLRDWLTDRKGVKHLKSAFFFDQFLDTPRSELLKAGASLRLRYKKGGEAVYLQYKGPGFFRDGVLYRSEFSSPKLAGVLLEESHHDIVHFTDTSVDEILRGQTSEEMASAMRRHLGPAVVKRISCAPIIALYQKDKFEVDLGSALLEPSLDKIFAFHIGKGGLHPLSTFSEFENEIKGSLDAKLDHLEEMLEFNAAVRKRFDLSPERLDKYHRCASFFVTRS